MQINPRTSLAWCVKAALIVACWIACFYGTFFGLQSFAVHPLSPSDESAIFTMSMSSGARHQVLWLAATVHCRRPSGCKTPGMVQCCSKACYRSSADRP